MDISRRTFIKASSPAAHGPERSRLRPLARLRRGDGSSRLTIWNEAQVSKASWHSGSTRCCGPDCAVGCGTIAYVHGRWRAEHDQHGHPRRGRPRQPDQRRHVCIPKGASQMQSFTISPRLQHQWKFRAVVPTSGVRRPTPGTSRSELVLARERAVSGGIPAPTFDPIVHLTWAASSTRVRRDRVGGASATVANEDAYLITKTMRAMGLGYIDHQARI